MVLHTASANPAGMTVVSGTATSSASGSRLNVTTGPIAVLDWNSFNIAPGQTTTFVQPGANSVVFNQIGDANPSLIFGSLTGNGTVVLANQHGFYFGPSSFISVGGSFIATTTPLPPDPGPGGNWQFNGPPPLASIINYGQIHTRGGGSLFLIAERIENQGDLDAPIGSVGLYAGKEVLISERPDGRGLSANLKLPSGSVDNNGRITADAGTIALQAQVVNQGGIIQADSVREQNGSIELVASDELNLEGTSQILARGQGSGGASSGGQVTLKSGNVFRDHAGSKVTITGGSEGGNGGDLEISAPNIVSLSSALNGGARSGSRAGRLLVDPTEIILDNSGAGSAGNGTVGVGSSPGVLDLNVNTAFLGLNFSQILLQASGSITLSSGTVWDLSQSTGLQAGALKLQAGHDIVFGNGAGILDANNWSVALEAGVNFSSGTVQPRIGSIFLNGGSGKSQDGFIQTAQGSINLTAGQDVLVGSGSVTSSGGGSIQVRALSGDVNAGKNNGGFAFVTDSPGYVVDPANLGGISTAEGGDVTIQAGRDVISVPTVPLNQTPGASGAYGSKPGNVTVIAGDRILGNFLVRNGTGRLEAGVSVQDGQPPQIINPLADIGLPTQPVSLSLISGSWEAWAARDLYLSEIRNPNGTFNSHRLPLSPGSFPGNVDASGSLIAPPSLQAFLFDYAADAGASLWAGNSVTLGGSRLPRISGENQQMPAVYPPRLSVEAGSGGINIENSLVLYPSAQGELRITTHDGGNLQGADASPSTFIYMSDSGLPNWSSFERGHAVTPLHLHDPKLVTLDISGDLNSLVLSAPMAAQVDVGGNAYNFGFLGQNLSPSSATTINVAGSISYRSILTSVFLPGLLPAQMLDGSLTTQPDTLARLVYDPASGKLTFFGVMNSVDLAYLLNPTVYVVDGSGQPVLDGHGIPETRSITLTSADQAVIQQLYTASQTAVVGGDGLHLAGPGFFKVNVGKNMDLGIADGISFKGPEPDLTRISPYSGLLDIAVGGDLSMTSTAIANEGLGGGIQLSVGGKLDVGVQNNPVSDNSQSRGIFTSGGGRLFVLANGDINVNGSRIATYDGGDLTVISKTGDVNAGSGGAGFVNTAFVQLDASGNPETRSVSISGSGILAVVPGESSATVGNVLVQAEQGSINANLGGIEQIAFNRKSDPSSFIQLQAGKDINAGNSGVLGSDIQVKAGGSIEGIFVGTGGVSINAGNNFSGTVVGSSTVAINAGGSVSGTVVGGSSVSVKGDTITASLISANVSTSGDASGASVGVPASSVPKEDTKVAEDASATLAKIGDSANDDARKKKKQTAGLPQLAKTESRVTVILPQH